MTRVMPDVRQSGTGPLLRVPPANRPPPSAPLGCFRSIS